MPEVVCQEWEESEYTSGWGVDIRYDGFSLHKNVDDLKAFIKKHWKGYPDGPAPDYYVRPAGEPYFVKLRSNSKLYQELLRSNKKGIRKDKDDKKPTGGYRLVG